MTEHKHVFVYQVFSRCECGISLSDAFKEHQDEIERLKKESKEWKSFYFEALEKLQIVSVELDDAFERAASVCDEQERLQYATGCDECAVQAKRDAHFIRALKSGEPK